MRLIDADEITELFDKEYKATRLLIEQGEEYLDNLAEGFTEAYDIIQRIPTNQAEPVKHGRWIESNDEYGMYLECSVCGEDFVSWESDCARTNYCPQCGAQMDKGEEDG